MADQEYTSEKTQMILDELSNQKTENQDTATMEEMVELVIFTMGKGYFAFMGTDVREILPHSTVTHVPGCPPVLRGIINVRGAIESIVNLHALLEMDDVPPTPATRFILARSGEMCSGIAVESVVDVITMEKKVIKPVISTLPAVVKKFALGGETFYKENYVIVLSVEKLFSTLLK